MKADIEGLEGLTHPILSSSVAKLSSSIPIPKSKASKRNTSVFDVVSIEALLLKSRPKVSGLQTVMRHGLSKKVVVNLCLAFVPTQASHSPTVSQKASPSPHRSRAENQREGGARARPPHDIQKPTRESSVSGTVHLRNDRVPRKVLAALAADVIHSMEFLLFRQSDVKLIMYTALGDAVLHWRVLGLHDGDIDDGGRDPPTDRLLVLLSSSSPRILIPYADHLQAHDIGHNTRAQQLVGALLSKT